MINQHFRLATVRRLTLLLSGDTIDYAHLTRLAASALRTPIAYIALFDEPHPHYISVVGLPTFSPTESTVQLTNAMSKQIAALGKPVTIADTRHQLYPRPEPGTDQPALVAHAGVPIMVESGLIVGAVCVADTAPRQWTTSDCALLKDIATAFEREIDLRESAARGRIGGAEQVDPVCCYLSDGTLTFANDACCHIFGRPQADLLGDNVCHWLFESDSRRFEQHLEQLWQQQCVLEDRRTTLPDGSTRWFQWTERLILNAAGRIVEVQATAHDITERKQVEEALRASEERFRALSTASPVGVFLANSEGHCLYSNPRLEAITALTTEQLLGNGWIQRIHPDDTERVVREWREFARAGREQVTEYRLLWPDGSVHWIRSHNAPLLDTTSGLIGHVGTIEDITERRNMEEALRASEERFRLAVNTMPYPLVMYDPALRIQFLNTPGLELLGKTDAELLGKTDAELFDVEQTSDYLPTLQQAAALRTIQSTECSFRCGQSVSTFLITYVPLLDERGDLRQILGIAYDITERSRAEEQRITLERKLLETQKLESLGVLAGGIAHDFNNLLGAIMGNAELALLDLPPESDPYDCVAQIKLATQRAADLTQQMLAYSGRGRFVVQRIDLNGLIREMHHLLSASVDKTATVHYQLAETLPPLMADATQLRQVVMNLLINAAEAIGEAGGKIRVTTTLMEADQAYLASTDLAPDLAPGRYVALSVSDTGCGMSPATLAKIFDPFFTTKFTGRGLGLAAVQGIVRGHHGTLKVQSTPGGGTTFTILLPPVPGTDEHPPVRIAEREKAEPWQSQGTVLVVDDEPGVQMTAARALQRFGFEVLLAADGQVGVEIFRRHAPTIACVLLDLTMPQLNGEQALHAIRAIDPAARIIVMSGYDEQEVLSRFANVTLDGFLHKPFRPDELRAVLQGTRQRAA